MEVRQICNLRAISVLLTPARYSFHPGGRGAPPFVVGEPRCFLIPCACELVAQE